jgi:hypothetical protein
MCRFNDEVAGCPNASLPQAINLLSGHLDAVSTHDQQASVASSAAIISRSIFQLNCVPDRGDTR